MSFGFSISDFLAGATLIKEIISALRGTAKLEYRELELELHGLQRALDELEHLQPGPGQEVAVNSVKAAALMCRYPLEEFQANLKRYQLLSKHGHHRKLDVVEGWVRKVQWNISMPDEVQKLRAYIAAHVGSLNMRLLTLGLTIMTVAQAEASERDSLIQNELDGQMRIVNENKVKVGTIYTLVTSQVVPQLQSLVGLVEKNNQTQIDVRHTWFQEPLRLDDAFGRTIPIPVEYGWSKLEAIIHDQFCCGPGNEKIFAGEYEIFNTEDSSQLITQRNFSLLRPGSAITMAMVIGRYEEGVKDQCPKPGCKSKMYTKSSAGGLICAECSTWFGKSQTALPRPFRLLCIEKLQTENFGGLLNGKKRQRSTQIARRDIFKEMREERKWFKNLRIHLTDLSSATSILDEQWGAESRPKRAKFEMPMTILRPNQDFREMEFNPKRLRQSLLSIPNTSTLMNGMWGIVRKIIIEEVGLEEEDLEDDPDFASLGIDSLMSLRILGRLRENLEVDLGGMDFDQYPDVRELRKFFEHFHPGQEIPHKSLRTQSTPKTLTPTNGTWGIIRKIIIEEIGLEEEDLEDDLDFADVGIDSLMSLTILGRLRENLEVDLGGMIFDQYPNVRELRKFFERFYPGQETPHKSLRTQSTPQTDPHDGKEIL